MKINKTNETRRAGSRKHKPAKNHRKREMRSTIIRSAPVSSFTRGLPDEMIVDFVYNDITLSRLSGTQFSYFLLRLGGLYDPDPSLGSGTISTFPEYALLYNFYQVQSVKIEWEVLNLDTIPKTVYYYITHAAKYPGTVADAVDFAELSNATKPMTIGPELGGNAFASSCNTVNLSAVFGDSQKYRTNSSFYSVTNTVPSSNVVAVFVAYGPATMTNGVYSSCRITYTAKLWERANAIA